MWEAYRNVSMLCERLWPNVPLKQTNEKVPLQSLLAYVTHLKLEDQAYPSLLNS